MAPLWKTLAASAPSTPACGEDRGEMLHRAGAPGGDQRHVADTAHGLQLAQVISLADAVARHAVEDDFAGAAVLDFTHPVERAAARAARAVRIPRELVDLELVADRLAVDADHDAL